MCVVLIRKSPNKGRDYKSYRDNTYQGKGWGGVRERAHGRDIIIRKKKLLKKEFISKRCNKKEFRNERYNKEFMSER